MQANNGWHLKYRHSERDVHLDLVRCLAEKTDLDILDDSGVDVYAGSPEALEWLLAQSNLSSRPRTPQECFFVATSVALCANNPNLASLVRVALGGRQIHWSIGVLKDSSGSSLLHHTASYLGEHHAAMKLRYLAEDSLNGVRIAHFDKLDAFWSRWNQVELDENLKLIRDLVTASDDYLCERNLRLRTPLLEVCDGISQAQRVLAVIPRISWLSRSWQKQISDQSPQVPIRIWLEQIAKAGVDLMEYGRRESRLHLKDRVKKQWTFHDWFQGSPTYGEKIFTLWLISFTYGPSAENWQFWFTEAMNDSFMEFWHMVDHPEQGMPGAWNEYGGCDNDDIWY